MEKDLNVKIPDSLLKWLYQFAREQEWTLSKTVIVALENYRYLAERLPEMNEYINEHNQRKAIAQAEEELQQAILEGGGNEKIGCFLDCAFCVFLH